MACWIESHTVLMRHRKVAELARGLRICRAHAIGHLHALWHAALEQQENGNLSSWSDEFIAEMSDVALKLAPQYVRLLQSTGFLGYKNAAGEIVTGSDRIIHDWIDYAGRYLMNKYASGNRPLLVQIWAMHGRVYGRKDEPAGNASETQVNSNYTIPDRTKPTKPTTPTHPPSAGAGGGGEAERLKRRKAEMRAGDPV